MIINSKIELIHYFLEYSIKLKTSKVANVVDNMEINWENYELVSSTINNFATIFFNVLLVIIAFRGINAWRRETRGNNLMDLSKKTIILALKFQSAMLFARSKYTWPHESQTRSRLPDETEREMIARNNRYARLNRLETVRQILIELEETIWEADVVLKRDLQHHLKTFQHTFIVVQQAVLRHYYTQENNHSSLQEDDLSKILHTEDNDEINQLISESVTKLKEEFKRYIR